MGTFFCSCRYLQHEITLADIKLDNGETSAAIKIQRKYKKYKIRKNFKFIIKRKLNVAKGIEIKQSWDCTNKLKIPEGFEYTEKNITYLKREILNFYSLFFTYQITPQKIVIKEEDLLNVTKENFLEKFRLRILIHLMKNFDLSLKANELHRVQIDDTFQEKLVTNNYKQFSLVNSIRFGDDGNKFQILKKKSTSDSSDAMSFSFINNDNGDSSTIRSSVKNKTSRQKDECESKNEISTPDTAIKKIRRILFKIENFTNENKIPNKTTRDTTTDRLDNGGRNIEMKHSEERGIPNYFNLITKKSLMRLWEDNNSTTIERILNEIITQTGKEDFITFLDNEEGTFYEGTVFSNYDKQGLGIELLYDKAKGLRYKYLGYFFKNQFHGYGIIAYENGLFYKGEFRGGKRTGYGIEISHTCNYRGFFLNNKYSGYGELKAGSETYMGCFENGLKDGFGYIEYEDSINNRYVGSFRNNLMDGVGLLVLPNQNYYYGEFKDNLMNGRGQFKWPSGDIYVGGYQKNLKHGEGEYFISSNKAILKGSWMNGEKIDEFQVFRI